MKITSLGRLLLAIALAPGCTSGTEEVLPLSRAIIGYSVIEAVEIAHSGERVETIGAPQPIGNLVIAQPIRRASAASKSDELRQAIIDIAQRSGMTSGRKLKLIVEIDEFTGTAAALRPKDRLAGTVFVRDLETGAALGQLYVDVTQSTPGMVGLLARASGIRSSLIEEFAQRVVRAISGPQPSKGRHG